MNTRGQQVPRDILAILRREGAPLSAYKVLAEMRRATPKMAPTTIYRALAALIKAGRVHKLESLNAFIACRSGQQDHSAVLSICDDCGQVEEAAAPEVLEALSALAGRSGFRPVRHLIELRGHCASCDNEEVSP